jgi:hypothetical protein
MGVFIICNYIVELIDKLNGDNVTDSEIMNKLQDVLVGINNNGRSLRGILYNQLYSRLQYKKNTDEMYSSIDTNFKSMISNLESNLQVRGITSKRPSKITIEQNYDYVEPYTTLLVNGTFDVSLDAVKKQTSSNDAYTTRMETFQYNYLLDQFLLWKAINTLFEKRLEPAPSVAVTNAQTDNVLAMVQQIMSGYSFNENKVEIANFTIKEHWTINRQRFVDMATLAKRLMIMVCEYNENTLNDMQDISTFVGKTPNYYNPTLQRTFNEAVWQYTVNNVPVKNTITSRITKFITEYEKIKNDDFIQRIVSDAYKYKVETDIGTLTTYFIDQIYNPTGYAVIQCLENIIGGDPIPTELPQGFASYKRLICLSGSYADINERFITDAEKYAFFNFIPKYEFYDYSIRDEMKHQLQIKTILECASLIREQYKNNTDVVKALQTIRNYKFVSNYEILILVKQ